MPGRLTADTNVVYLIAVLDSCMTSRDCAFEGVSLSVIVDLFAPPLDDLIYIDFMRILKLVRNKSNLSCSGFSQSRLDCFSGSIPFPFLSRLTHV